MRNVLHNDQRWRRATKRHAAEDSLHTDPQQWTAPVPWSEAVGTQGEAPQALALQRDHLERLKAAIQKLPAQMRRTLLLRLAHDLSNQQIGELLKISRDTVRAHLYEGRLRLRQELNRSAEGGAALPKEKT
jgi:RNA polymerase sigma-70 factor (ECF subfamily)